MGGQAVSRIEEYRRLAAECVDMAAMSDDHQFKGILVDMAGAWLKLAEQADKNSQADLTYETPPPSQLVPASEVRDT